MFAECCKEAVICQQQMIAVRLSVCSTGKLRLLRNIFSAPGNRQQVARAGPLHSKEQEKKKRGIANCLFHPVAAKVRFMARNRGIQRDTGIKKHFGDRSVFIRSFYAAAYQGYLFSAISVSAIRRRASLLLNGSVLVNRFRPSSIMRCSSPLAKALIASLPDLFTRSTASLR